MADDVRESESDPRALAAKPFEELDEAAGGQEQDTRLAGAKRAAATATAAALVGALAGAAKAYVDRRSSGSEREKAADDDADDVDDPTDVPGATTDDTEQAGESEDEGEDESDEDPQGAASPQPQDEQAEERDEEPDEQPQRDHRVADSRPARGASTSQAASIVEQARRQLQELIGAEAESVSALQRVNGTWTVTLEVVEVRRVPESTDVLSSYDVVLDDDGGVVSLTRSGRYRRSQVEGN